VAAPVPLLFRALRVVRVFDSIDVGKVIQKPLIEHYDAHRLIRQALRVSIGLVTGVSGVGRGT
jgi:2-phosphoglycerate kinase